MPIKLCGDLRNRLSHGLVPVVSIPSLSLLGGSWSRGLVAWNASGGHGELHITPRRGGVLGIVVLRGDCSSSDDGSKISASSDNGMFPAAGECCGDPKRSYSSQKLSSWCGDW